MLVTRPLSGKLADKGMIRNISLTGILLLSTSFILFSTIDTGSSEVFIILSMIIRGLGISFLIAPVSTAMLNAVKSEQTPTATSLNTLMLQLGGSVGIAASSALHTHLLKYYNEKGYTKLLAEHYSLRNGFLVTSCIILLAFLPAIRLPQRAREKVKNKEALG
jgi:DHA2 family multidrug resistance protein